MTDPITPALSPDEWAYPHGCAAFDGSFDFDIGYADVRTMHASDPDRFRHALAALCLNEQPQGFTWADVDALQDVVTSDYSVMNDIAALASLRDRIAALLPPREGT